MRFGFGSFVVPVSLSETFLAVTGAYVYTSHICLLSSSFVVRPGLGEWGSFGVRVVTRMSLVCYPNLLLLGYKNPGRLCSYAPPRSASRLPR